MKSIRALMCLKGFDGQNWYGVLAPASTPVPVVNKISAEIARILTRTDVRDKLQGQGMDPYYSTPEQFSALMKSDLAKYTKVIRTANIRMDN